ncbi:MAG: flavin reductase family protein [Burkholderiales bacterium]|nr:flavin reductase family protein [Burkholderiales bacterium]
MNTPDSFNLTFDSRQFRNALGSFATGVAVVACVAEDGTPLASTVSSFNSVSLDPPLVLFSLANSALSLQSWLDARHYTVSVLHADQAALSNRFARAGEDKWRDVCPVRGPVTDLPLLPNALAWFECAAYGQHEGGDHTIMVGRVLSFRTRMQSDDQPLVFFKGRYRKLARESEALPVDDGLYLHAW